MERISVVEIPFDGGTINPEGFAWDKPAIDLPKHVQEEALRTQQEAQKSTVVFPASQE